MGRKNLQPPHAIHYRNGRACCYPQNKPQAEPTIKGAHAPTNRWNATYHGENRVPPTATYVPAGMSGYRSNQCTLQGPHCSPHQNSLNSPTYACPTQVNSSQSIQQNSSGFQFGMAQGYREQFVDNGFYQSNSISTPHPNVLLSNEPHQQPVYGQPHHSNLTDQYYPYQYHHSSLNIAVPQPLGFPLQDTLANPVQYDVPLSSLEIERLSRNDILHLPGQYKVHESLMRNDWSYDIQEINQATFPVNEISSHLNGAEKNTFGVHEINRDNERSVGCNLDPELVREAISYAQSVYPNLGKQLYCIPAIDRFPHPHKANRLLVTRMEGEKRVLGSFKQYFASKNLSAVMLYYYPINGFLHYWLDDPLTDKRKMTGDQKTDPKPAVITLIILSSKFPVIVVNVCVINSNSDFVYLQRALHRAVSHSKHCGRIVRQWLRSIMGVHVPTKDILAFPNLRKSTMQRLLANNRAYLDIPTLLMDDLSAPFEEEWSTVMHKLHFTDWIENHVITGETGLPAHQLPLVVGTMCCPQLSKFDSPLMEEPQDSGNTTPHSLVEDVTQLKLTIDGETKGFDEYIEEAVSFYYPNLETETYRVPPVHFNIQGQEKLDENIFFSNCEGRKTKAMDSDWKQAPFMPLYKSYRYTVCCKEHTVEDARVNVKGQECKYTLNDDSRMANWDSSSFVSEEKLEAKTTSADARARISKAMEGVYQLSDVMTKDVRADEGESRVMNAFELLGRKHSPMFIICSYQYNNYLNKLREEMFSKAEAARPVRAFGQKMRAQHDCLIFHKSYGAIIVCIKAIGDNFEEWGASEEDKISSTINTITKAIKQLDREEAMVQHVASDLSRSIQCYKIIAFPNMYRADLSKVLDHAPELLKKIMARSGNLGAEAVLCQDELPSQFFFSWNSMDSSSANNQLIQWWENLCTNMFVKQEMDSQNYRQIVGRYCGLFSTVEVWTQTTPRIEVRSLSEAAMECSQRFSKILLLPEQVAVLHLDLYRLFIQGPPGSGKTMLLMLKVQEWLCKGFKVIWLNVRRGFQGYPFAFGVERKLRITLHKLKLPQSNLVRMDLDSSQFESEMLANILPSYRVVVDEVSLDSHPIIEHLCNLHLDRIWCASIREECCPITATGFASFRLERILRCPPTIQNLMKELESNFFTADGVIDEELMNDTQMMRIPVDEGMNQNVCLVNSSTMPLSNDSAQTLKLGQQNKGETMSVNTQLDFLHLGSSHSGNYALATDGLQPIIIDHSGHSLPMECDQCGQVLARHLLNLFQTKHSTDFIKDSMLKHDTNEKNSHINSPGNDSKTGRSWRKINGAKETRFKWSEGLIVSRHVEKNSTLVKTLKKLTINVEVVTESAANQRLEDPSENKLFFTTFHEATGLERCVVVFIPSLKPDQNGIGRSSCRKGNSLDLKLQTCLSRFHEDDQRALWHIASRSLSTLIMILP